MIARKLFLPLIFFCVQSVIFGQTSDVKTLRVGLNAPGEVLIVAPGGAKFGFDAASKKEFREIAGGDVSTARDREPVYRVPVGDAAKDLTIRVFGKTAGAKGDLGISGGGFSVFGS